MLCTVVLLSCYLAVLNRRAHVLPLREDFSEQYSIQEIPEFLNDEQCDVLVSAAQTELHRSTVIGRSGAVSSDTRTSRQKWLCDGRTADHRLQQILHVIHQKAGALTNVTDLNRFECVQIAAYKPSEKFLNHYDSHVCIEPENGEIIKRQYTILVYLNDDFVGGETEFPNLKRIIKPQKGTAVLFQNLNDGGCEHIMSMHAGLPVIFGVKYIANIWIKA